MKSSTPKLLRAALCAMLAAHVAHAAADTNNLAGARAALAPSAEFQKRAARRKPARRAGAGRPAAPSPVSAKQPARGDAKGATKEEGATVAPRSEAVTNDTSTLGMTPEQALAVAIREALRPPREGETRARGVLTRIECGPENAAIFHVRVGAETLRLDGGDLGGVHFMAFTPRETGSEIACGPRKLNSTVVVTYRARDNDAARLVAVEFVPATFTLDK